MITDAENNAIEAAFQQCFDMYWEADVKTYGEKAAARRMFQNGGYEGLSIANNRKDWRDGKF